MRLLGSDRLARRYIPPRLPETRDTTQGSPSRVSLPKFHGGLHRFEDLVARHFQFSQSFGKVGSQCVDLVPR